jgi:hypothetical protein
MHAHTGSGGAHASPQQTAKSRGGQNESQRGELRDAEHEIEGEVV